MSAFICTPEHIAAIATSNGNKSISVFTPGKNREYFSPRDVARELMKENIRSVASRYPADEDGNRAGPQMKDEDLINAAGELAETCLDPLDPVQIIKLCHCLDYQSCETPDWDETLAYLMLQSIQEIMTYQLPGYDEAHWSI